MGLFQSLHQSSNFSDRHVIIIGGGYGGVELASILKKWRLAFTLIDPKEYFHHNVGALRAVVDEEYVTKTTIDFKTSFGNNFCLGWVTNIDLENNCVFVSKQSEEEQEVIQYTDLVIAVGTNGPFPSKVFSQNAEDAAMQYKELRGEIVKSETIVLVGGGAVGVEFAGEIKETFPDKRVTLIHSKEYLVSKSFGDKFCEDIKDQLETSFGINVILGERVSNLDHLTSGKCIKQMVETDKGKSLEVDLVLKCTGLIPNTTLTQKVFSPEAFEEGGGSRLKVDERLLILGQTNIYAIGDCCNTKEEKLAAHAGNHAKFVALNIWRDIHGKEKKPYVQAFDGILVTLGRIGGAGIMFGWKIPSFIVGLFKSRSLFTSKFWSLMEQRMPN